LAFFTYKKQFASLQSGHLTTVEKIEQFLTKKAYKKTKINLDKARKWRQTLAKVFLGVAVLSLPFPIAVLPGIIIDGLILVVMTWLAKQEIMFESHSEDIPQDKLKKNVELIKRMFTFAGLYSSYIVFGMWRFGTLIFQDNILTPLEAKVQEGGILFPKTFTTLFDNSIIDLLLGIALAIATYSIFRAGYERLFEQRQLYYEDFFSKPKALTQAEAEHLGKHLTYEGMDTDANLYLGVDLATNEEIVLPTDDRTLHWICFGPTGSGKSESVIKPACYQDIIKIGKYMEEYSKFREATLEKYPEKDANGNIARYNYIDENGAKQHLTSKEIFDKEWFTEDRAKNMVNALVVVDPMESLAPAIAKYAKQVGIPDELIAYVNPISEDTATINIMDGDPDEIAPMFTSVLSTIFGEGGSPYFHDVVNEKVQNTIYLLKYTAEIPNDFDARRNGNRPTMEQLVELYTDVKAIRERLNILTWRRELLELKVIAQIEKSMSASDYNALKDENPEKAALIYHEAMEDCLSQEQRDKMSSYDEVIGYFRSGYKNNKDGEFEEDEKVKKDVKRASTMIASISKNKYLKNVFYRQTNFDLERFMSIGGILVINTANKELAKDSQLVGGLFTSLIQQAVYRRKENVAPLVTMIYDEAPQYITPETSAFAAMARKMRTSFVVLAQNLSQIMEIFPSNDAAEAFLGNMSHQTVFALNAPKDRKYFSEKFGAHKEIESYSTSPDRDEQGGKVIAKYDEKVQMKPNITPEEFSEIPRWNMVGVIKIDQVNHFVRFNTTPAFRIDISHYTDEKQGNKFKRENMEWYIHDWFDREDKEIHLDDDEANPIISYKDWLDNKSVEEATKAAEDKAKKEQEKAQKRAQKDADKAVKKEAHDAKRAEEVAAKRATNPPKPSEQPVVKTPKAGFAECKPKKSAFGDLAKVLNESRYEGRYDVEDLVDQQNIR
jgi:hypothetical protein